MPFLTVVTRCYQKPTMLQHNMATVDAQTCDDWEQLLIVDEVGHGLAWANAQFAKHAKQAGGDYVLMLDDDDAFADDEAIAILKDAAQDRPELIVFRGDHCEEGILPTDEVWKKRRPKLGQISGQDFVTRADVWKKHIGSFAQPIQGDYAFLAAMWPELSEITWIDRVLVKQQRISRGMAE